MEGEVIDNGPPTSASLYYPALIPATFLARIAIWVWGAYAVWQGWGIAAGGDERWTDPPFSVLRQLPNPTLTWGWALIICGVLIMIGSILQMMHRGRRRAFVGLVLKGAGLIGTSVWCIVLAWGSLDAAAAYYNVTTTAGPTYIVLAVQMIILIFVDERATRRDDLVRAARG